DYLKGHSQITKVIFPKYFSGENKTRTQNYLEEGYGGLVGFEIKGGKEAGKAFIDALELIYHVANIGDARTLAIHPATTTHSQLSEEDQIRSGVIDSYVRLSIGIEHIDDIIKDIDKGLAAAK
ncbi:MAG: O-succinylhomoserine sulfhydrylase, partial [Alphaproteobacteria bacterium MarineAlpha9_Bin1]